MIRRMIYCMAVFMIWSSGVNAAYESTYERIQWDQRGEDTYYCVDICDTDYNVLPGLQSIACGDNLYEWSFKQALYDYGIYGVPDGSQFGWRVWSESGYGGEGFEGIVTVGAEKKKTPVLDFEFIYISEGKFKMGSPGGEIGRYKDEERRDVMLTRAFYLLATEVTQGQWMAVMGSNPSFFSSCGWDCPVENVSWNDIQSFLYRLNESGDAKYRLPTEAEWEYAARAGSTKAYAFGDDLELLTEYGNFCDANCQDVWNDTEHDDGMASTARVKNYAPNDWGLYDMHGNVWEWCQDWYDAYPKGALTDPQGPETGTSRVFRGGSWRSVPQLLRSALRNGTDPTLKHNNLGFRLVREIP